MRRLTYRKLYSLPGYQHEAIELSEDFPEESLVELNFAALKEKVEKLHQQSEAMQIDWETRELRQRSDEYEKILGQIEEMKRRIYELTMYKGIPDRIRVFIENIRKEIGGKENEQHNPNSG